MESDEAELLITQGKNNKIIIRKYFNFLEYFKIFLLLFYKYLKISKTTKLLINHKIGVLHNLQYLRYY